MAFSYVNDVITMLADPSEDDLCTHFEPSLVAKLLKPLDPSTGDASRGEVQCVRIANVVFNRFTLEAFYETRRPDGSKGTQFLRFYPWSAVMRCLAVTEDGRVVLLQEYRRQRGAWVDGMHIAGGVKKGGLVHALKEEMLAEAGCTLGAGSRILSLGAHYMDDGVFADPLHLLVVDRVQAPRRHRNPEESIRGIRLVAFDDWRKDALSGKTSDIFATIFAARCRFDRKRGRVRIGGTHELLFPRHTD